jgi:hypothetical protein
MARGDFQREVARTLQDAQRGPLAAQRAIRQLRVKMRKPGAFNLAERGEVDKPSFPRKSRPEMPFFRPIIAPHRFLVLGDVVQVNANSPSSTLRVEFSQGEGWVLGWRGTVRADGSDLARSSMGVKLNINGKEPLITNGQTEDYGLFDILFPRNADTWTPLLIPMGIKDILRVDFFNFHTVNNYTPALVFAFHDGLGLFGGNELLAR